MNEFELIKNITASAPASLDRLVKGIGDDCAVVSQASGKDMLITTDSLFDGVHFKMDWISPRTLGRKALSVNVSDIAAMGGKPLYYLVSIGIPKGMGEKNIQEIFDGMAQVAHGLRMNIIGGDTCASEKGLLLSLTVIGEVEHTKCLYRSGAKAGDAVYVTGTFGGSALGLACMEKGLRNMHMREFIRMHDDPIPRVTTGAWLAASTCVSSMIDVSDGLAGDLSHIANESGISIHIDASKIPLPEGIDDAAAQVHKDPLALALSGGEDYELAFTVHASKVTLFEKMLEVMLPTFGHKVTRIGDVVEGMGVRVKDIHGKDMPLGFKGFEHKF